VTEIGKETEMTDAKCEYWMIEVHKEGRMVFVRYPVVKPTPRFLTTISSSLLCVFVSFAI
jgi:hypothetical protein